MHAESDDKIEPTYDEALKRAARICARSEQCGAAVSRRLEEWGVPAETAAAVIKCLYENSYIDDNRYIRSFVNDKFRFGKWGRQKIRYALKENGLSGTAVEEALKKIDEEEYLSALRKAITEKAAKRGGIETYADRAAVYNFCISRGYESDLTNKAIDEYRKKQEK